jgi:hypothetical protein
VTYEADGEICDAHNCHCARCRKATGAAYRSTLFIPAETFQYTSGAELVRRCVPAEDRYSNSFCSVCGSSLPGQFPQDGRQIIGLPMGTLDVDPGLGPERHVLVDSKAPWHEITDELPQYDGLPPNPHQPRIP